MPRSYRIIGDETHGYEVQIRWRWFDVWERAGTDHTHDTLADAQAHARRHAKFKPIEIVGVLPMNGNEGVAE